jgi:hypothetical protein
VEDNPKSTHHEHALLEGESTSPVKAPEKQILTQMFGLRGLFRKKVPFLVYVKTLVIYM